MEVKELERQDILEKSYYENLELFKNLCLKLNEKKQYYNTIILNHELYRFLYPTEPFLNFTHQKPASAIVELIKKLCRLASEMLTALQGYPHSHYEDIAKKENCLEQRTSNLYTSLWHGYTDDVIINESQKFILYRLGNEIIEKQVKGKKVLDLGCGSGRNSLALSSLGAAKVIGMDYHRQSYQRSQEIAKNQRMNIEFREGNALALPFEDKEFDFVYSNGVLHHTQDWKGAIDEYFRVMKTSGFIYLYATGGFFWTTRKVMRQIFLEIPQRYCLEVLHNIGMPSHRMIFMDVWFVPIEDHLSKAELETIFSQKVSFFKKLVSRNPIDLDKALMDYPEEGTMVWGEGEHRYFVQR